MFYIFRIILDFGNIKTLANIIIINGNEIEIYSKIEFLIYIKE